LATKNKPQCSERGIIIAGRVARRDPLKAKKRLMAVTNNKSRLLQDPLPYAGPFFDFIRLVPLD